MLLTFTNIRNEAGAGNDVFDQSTKILADMSQALGTDMKTSAIQLGKALNDPIQGMSALQRVGVSFTTEQKTQVTAMQKAGDTVGAQKLILAELNKEFGGSAKAAGDAAPWTKLKNHVGDAFRDIAAKALPVTDKLASWAADELPKAMSAAGAAFRAVSEIVQAKVMPVVRALWTAFQANVLPTVQQVAQLIVATFVPVLQQLWATFQTKILPVVQQVVGFFTGVLLPALSQLVVFVASNVLPIFAAVYQVIAQKIIPAVVTLVSHVLAHLMPAIQGLIVRLQENRQHFQQIFDVIKVVIKVIAEVVGWVAQKLAPVLGVVLGTALKVTIGIIGTLIGVIGGIVGAIGSVVSFTKGAATDITNAFGAVLDFFESMPGKIAGFFSSVWHNIVDDLKSALDFMLHLPLKIPQIRIGAFGHYATVGGQTLIPAFAAGTDSAPGGMALVGERGPEVVNLPRGSQVIPNSQLGAPTRLHPADMAAMASLIGQSMAAALNNTARQARLRADASISFGVFSHP